MTTSANSAILVRDLVKHHKGAAAPTLKSVSFSVEKGAIAAILGKSGAGKSTLLRCLCGLDAFDGGTIDVAGVHVAGGTSPLALRGKVGMVFQSLELFPHLNVLENLLLAPIHAHRAQPGKALRNAMSLLRDLDVNDKAKAYPADLSGGQRQRVAIARALMVEPQVLLYDEPTSALDAALKTEVGKTLAKVAERTGMTQLVVTHDPQMAHELAKTVWTLDAGQMTPTFAAGR